MIGVLVVSHSSFARGLLETGDMVLGNHNNCFCLGLTDTGVFEFEQLVKTKLDSMFESYDEVLVLCDLKGGTPYNQVFKYKLENSKENMVIVTGFNLPMFAELVVSLPYVEHASELANKIISIAKEAIERDNNGNETEENDDLFN